MNERIKNNTIHLLGIKESSEQVFFRAICSLKITKSNWKRHSVIFLICLAPALIASVSADTVEIMRSVTYIVLTTFLALFGIVFTGYAFFQALINKRLLLELLSHTTRDGEAEKSKLEETIDSFVDLMMQNIAVIILSLFAYVLLLCIPLKYVATSNQTANCIMAWVMIEIYFNIVGLIIWEIKTFVFNIFQLFTLHAGARALEILEDESNESEES